MTIHGEIKEWRLEENNTPGQCNRVVGLIYDYVPLFGKGTLVKNGDAIQFIPLYFTEYEDHFIAKTFSSNYILKKNTRVA
jgi:hypothetical protein